MSQSYRKFRSFIEKRDGKRCYTCKRRESNKIKLSLHHLVPRSFGGSDDPCNLRLVCLLCHRKIHQRIDEKVRDIMSSLNREEFENVVEQLRRELAMKMWSKYKPD